MRICRELYYWISLIALVILTPCANALAQSATVVTPPSPQETAAIEPIRWRMASSFAGALPQIGSMGRRIDLRINEISNGDIQIKFFEPNALVDPLKAFSAVSEGKIEAAFSTAGYWIAQEPGLQLFGAVPFGPRAAEYMAWFYNGGGQEIYRDLYKRQNIHSLICGVTTPEGAGWFKKEIKTVDDFKGMKVRFYGLGAKVLQRLGATTVLKSERDIYPAFELGLIDGAEFSMPSTDLKLGLYQIAKHYYLPGWHQPATFFDLMINYDQWAALSNARKAQIETMCGDNVRFALAESEASQLEALERIKAFGVEIHRLPTAVLVALKSAWQEVVTKEAEKDPNFKRAWESLSKFRARHQIWRDLGYLE